MSQKMTRIDMFANVDEYIKFLEWAKTKEPKTKADMIRLLAEYKAPDFVVDAHPEIVEHQIVQKFKVIRAEDKKEGSNESAS